MNRAIITLTMALMVLMTPVSSLAQSATAVQPIEDAERKALYPTRAMIEQGRGVVESACAGCHGMDGISDAQGKPHVAGQRAVYLYRVLQAFQNDTRPDEKNQHNKFLKDEALMAAAVYFANLTPATASGAVDQISTADASTPGAVTTEEDSFEAIRASMKKCIKCHEVSGNSDSNGMPSLTAQSPEYFVTSMLSYIDGSRSHKLMKKLVGRLDAADINEMGVYYAVQQPLKTENPGEGDVNVGRRLAKECESCHGENGNATKDKMPTLAGQDAKYFVKAMKHYKDGKRQHEKMFEAVEELSEKDMLDLATFYAGEEPHPRDVRMPLKSAEWIVRCERCHGIDGNSTDPRFPMLAGQDVTYLRNALRAYAIDERQSTTMHAMADPLSPRDIERIGTYFAAQKPKAVVYMQLPCGNDQQK
jgi:cytochrome c553